MQFTSSIFISRSREGVKLIIKYIQEVWQVAVYILNLCKQKKRWGEAYIKNIQEVWQVAVYIQNLILAGVKKGFKAFI